MFSIRYAKAADKPYWFSLERHMSGPEFDLKINEKRCYIISGGEKPVGIMRYNLFWDNIPFLTLIYFEEAFRRKGLGREAMQHWEREMRSLGYKMVMTSTRADEAAQHFYRKLGYRDCGCLVMDIPGFEGPSEIFLAKAI